MIRLLLWAARLLARLLGWLILPLAGFATAATAVALVRHSDVHPAPLIVALHQRDAARLCQQGQAPLCLSPAGSDTTPSDDSPAAAPTETPSAVPVTPAPVPAIVGMYQLQVKPGIPSGGESDPCAGGASTMTVGLGTGTALVVTIDLQFAGLAGVALSVTYNPSAFSWSAAAGQPAKFSGAFDGNGKTTGTLAVDPSLRGGLCTYMFSGHR